jgi:RNA polymerase sigma-70 factor, ECF subfamily
MADSDSLALEFEALRPHLRGVAYRVLGSFSDADDAVQEAWLRLSRSDVSDVSSLRAWLTTVTSRVALNMLESRGSRREDVSADVSEPGAAAGVLGGGAGPLGPEDEALLGDEVGAALQVLLDELEPRERLAFVLHDLFAVPFDDIAPVVDGTSTSARQLASRARRRLRSTSPQAVATSLAARADQQRAVVDAFFAAARQAQFATLLQILDPDVVMRADAIAVRMGADASMSGADAVARWINGRAAGAVPATVGGEPGAAWAVHGQVRIAFGFTVSRDGRITAISLIGDPDELTGLEVELASTLPGGYFLVAYCSGGNGANETGRA